MIERTLDLPPNDTVLVQEILNRFISGRPVFVFGSRATGKAKRRSDLDLCIGGDTPLDWSTKANLIEAFDESDLPIEVDIIDLSEATGIFRKRMMSESIPFPVVSVRVPEQVAA